MAPSEVEEEGEGMGEGGRRGGSHLKKPLRIKAAGAAGLERLPGSSTEAAIAAEIVMCLPV